MNEIDVYSQYFEAACVYHGVERRAALVRLTAASGEGAIRYTVSVAFFPHRDEEDYAVSGDAYAAETIYSAPGRRSKKREEGFDVPSLADRLAKSLGGEIFWDRPLREARRG